MPRTRKSVNAEKAKSRSSKIRSYRAVEAEEPTPIKHRRSRLSNSSPRRSRNGGESAERAPLPRITPRTSSRNSGTSSRKEKVAESVPETMTESVPDTSEASSSETPTKRKRNIPTKESVLEGFDGIITLIEEEIEILRNSPSKTKGIKFLRSLRKRLNTLRSQTGRVMKKRPQSNRKNNQNSGFLKKVNISKEMADFAGWDPDEKKSRVDVTRYLCDFIRDHDLQNPEDKRQIRVEDNPKLKKLLGYDSKINSDPLTYYRLQTYMKRLFPKNDLEQKST